MRDPATQLTWQVTQSESRLSFADAAAHCASATPPGTRIPSVTELQTLVDEARNLPAIDLDSFPGTAVESFWTSSPYAPITGDSWHVDFSDGSTGSDNATAKNWVRCVR